MNKPNFDFVNNIHMQKIMKKSVKFLLKNDVIEWRLPNKLLHRTDGPAIIWPDGTQYWYFEGVYHRTDGPAIIMNDGLKVWVKHGKCHRTDGPAIIHADGSTEYWLDNKEYDPITFLIKSYEQANQT